MASYVIELLRECVCVVLGFGSVSSGMLLLLQFKEIVTLELFVNDTLCAFWVT